MVFYCRTPDEEDNDSLVYIRHSIRPLQIRTNKRMRTILESCWPDYVLPSFSDAIKCALVVQYHYVMLNGSVKVQAKCSSCAIRYRLRSNSQRTTWTLSCNKKETHENAVPRVLKRERRRELIEKMKYKTPSELRALLASEEPGDVPSTEVQIHVYNCNCNM